MWGDVGRCGEIAITCTTGARPTTDSEASRSAMPVSARARGGGRAPRGSGAGFFSTAASPSFGMLASFCSQSCKKACDWAGAPGRPRTCIRHAISSRRNPVPREDSTARPHERGKHQARQASGTSRVGDASWARRQGQ